MAERAVHVPDAELRVLQILWERQPLSARDLAEAIYPRTTSSEISTVQKLLQRLEAKRLVRRDRSRHVHRFAPAVDRADFAGRQIEGMVDKLTDGSLAPLLTHLIRSKGLSAEERSELRKLLDEHPPSKKRGDR